MKRIYRRHAWLNADTMTPLYGIQTKSAGTFAWLNLAEDGKPLLFDAEEARDSKLRDLRKAARVAARSL